MNKLFQRIRLKYHKIEIYTLFFLSPIAVYLFILLLSFSENCKILNIGNNLQGNAVFAALVEKNMNSPFESIEYECENGNINFIHNLNDLYIVAERGFIPKIKKLAENTYSIDENYLSNPYSINKFSKFSFSLEGINKKKQLKIYIIKHVKGVSPQKIFISLDLSNRNKDKLLLETKPFIINNIKSFFDNGIARL